MRLKNQRPTVLLANELSDGGKENLGLGESTAVPGVLPFEKKTKTAPILAFKLLRSRCMILCQRCWESILRARWGQWSKQHQLACSRGYSRKLSSLQCHKLVPLWRACGFHDLTRLIQDSKPCKLPSMKMTENCQTQQHTIQKDPYFRSEPDSRPASSNRERERQSTRFCSFETPLGQWPMLALKIYLQRGSAVGPDLLPFISSVRQAPKSSPTAYQPKT